MEELRSAVQELARTYWNETADDDELETFPMSIVGFVLEYAIASCHFPSNATDEKVIAVMNKFQNSLAMCCVDVYAKAGAEGEKNHSENGISRTYKDSYIDPNLLDKLPNYVTVM